MTSAVRPHVSWVALGGVPVIFHSGLIFYSLTLALVSRPIYMALVLP